MSNLSVNNFKTLRLRIDKSYYWDFFINKDRLDSGRRNGGMSTDSLSAYIDMCDPRCVGDGWIYSNPDYQWENALSNGVEMNNIGYTGVDNGLITYRRDRIGNADFINYFTKSTFNVGSGDTRLQLHAVSGTTGLYEYPYELKECGAELNGGFFQGFFKTNCDEYYILPSNLDAGEEWNLEFVLNKCEMEAQSDKTLNDRYPENKGIFFYMGTRAENKWSYVYNKVDESAEECNQIDLSEYVEGCEIDKDTYNLNDFSDPNPEFVWTEEDENLWFYDYSGGDYTDYNYYGPQDGNKPSDWSDDYIDFNPNRPTVPDTPIVHIKIENCNGKCTERHEDDYETFRYVKVPYMSCGCGKRYRTKKVKVEGNSTPGNDWMDPSEFFDQGYISFPDGIDCDYDYIEPELDITNFEYETDNGLALFQSNQYYFYTDNRFILFDRTCDGFTTRNWVEGTKVMYTGINRKYKTNLFIVMNRTCTGYTVSNIDELYDEEAERYDTYADIYNNAFALQIDDNGAIGYRLMTIDCELSGENKTTVISGMSKENVISDCEWHCISVRIIGQPKTMRMMFYVDGKLVFITKELPKFDFRKLNDLDEKQEGVPYNISIGGGTQGLAETIVKNYMIDPYRTYPLEKAFAGSFIGKFRSFKFYTTKNDFTKIRQNYLYERTRWI